MQRADAVETLKTGDPGVAVTMLHQLLEAHPEDADLLGLLGIALEESGDESGAEAALRRALALPAETAIHLRNCANLASLLLEAGRRIEAAALLNAGWCWQHDRAPEPNELRAIVQIAEVMNILGLHDQTVALLAPLPRLVAPCWQILKPLATALTYRGELEQASALLDTHKPGDTVEHELSALRAHVLHAAGRPADAARARNAYLGSVPPVILPARDGQKLTVGVVDKPPSPATLLRPWPQAYFAINYPAQMARLLSDRYRMAAVFCGAGDDAVARFNAWRPDVIINNVTNGEYLQTGDNLAIVQSFLDRISPHVINPPDAAVDCTRQKNPVNLAGIEGLILPSVRRFRRDVSQIGKLIAEIESRTDYPMIVRTVYEQESRNMTLAQDRAELDEAIRKLEGAQFYVIEYLGQRRDRGFFRRMRSFFAGGTPTIIWVDYAPTWIVRSRMYIDLQTYRDHPDLLQKANAIVANPGAELGGQAMAALEAIGRKIPLDIFGMDFDVDEEGNIVFFETNATMRMQVRVPEAFAYPPEAMQRLAAALDRLLHKAAARRVQLNEF